MNQFNSTDEAGHSQGMLRGGSSFKLLVVRALRLACFLYVISVMIAASYYNWQYTREHSFTDWLVFGEIAPTAKAFVWPYFAAQHTKPQEVDRLVSALSQRQINEMQIMSANVSYARSRGGAASELHHQFPTPRQCLDARTSTKGD
jgi:hypothetical protein